MVQLQALYTLHNKFFRFRRTYNSVINELKFPAAAKMTAVSFLIVCLYVLLILKVVHSFNFGPHVPRNIYKSSIINMGLGDMFKNALANDPNLTPAQNPGHRKELNNIM